LVTEGGAHSSGGNIRKNGSPFSKGATVKKRNIGFSRDHKGGARTGKKESSVSNKVDKGAPSGRYDCSNTAPLPSRESPTRGTCETTRLVRPTSNSNGGDQSVAQDDREECFPASQKQHNKKGEREEEMGLPHRKRIIKADKVKNWDSQGRKEGGGKSQQGTKRSWGRKNSRVKRGWGSSRQASIGEGRKRVEQGRMGKQRKAFEHRRALEQRGDLLVKGPTGFGKGTRVSIYMLDDVQPSENTTSKVKGGRYRAWVGGKDRVE